MKWTKDDNGQKIVEEYTDYRSYLDYDIEIRKKDGSVQRFSDIYGEKSGSETQVPYYVAIAASFYQIYRYGNSVRIMLLDEAFDKMDDERIGSMMDFFNDIQSKTIHGLLDKYEKSKTFLGENQVNQKFSRRINELFPKYQDDAEYDFFCDVNEALDELQKAGLICVHFQRKGIITSVELNLLKLRQCYEFVSREPKNEEHDWLLEVMERYGKCTVLDKYFAAQRVKISKNQKVEYFDGRKQEFLDLLTLVELISTNEEEQFIRDFSVRHFLDSKRVEALANKAQALMYHIRRSGN